MEPDGTRRAAANSKNGTAHWLALHAVPGLGPKGLGQLVSAFGSPLEAMRAPTSQLLRIPRMTLDRVTRIRAAARRLPYYGAMARGLARSRVRVLVSSDASYPAQLRTLDGAPAILFVRGIGRELDRRSIAIIGSTRPSTRAIALTIGAARQAAVRGYNVVSGYARGVDSFAHAGALRAGGRTIAVLPTGIYQVRPRHDAPGPSEIAHAGALVSQFRPDEPWKVGNAMARNKVIVALGQLVLVMETRGGPGIAATCQVAKRLGRRAYVFCNHFGEEAKKASEGLIRAGLAYPVHSLAELSRILGNMTLV